MLEKKIEMKLREYMKSKNGKCLKFIKANENGIPDRLCIFPDGRLIFVELKKPKGGRLSKVQEVQIQKLKDLNQEVEVVSNINELSLFMKKYDEV